MIQWFSINMNKALEMNLTCSYEMVFICMTWVAWACHREEELMEFSLSKTIRVFSSTESDLLRDSTVNLKASA